MIEPQNICKKCILPDGFLGIKLDYEGICNFCRDPDYKNINWSRITIDQETRNNALSDWNNLVRNIQEYHSKDKYDCILGYSGGKDSTALLDYLIYDLGLSPLAITIDTGFMTKVAKDNMRNTLARIHVDHILIEECIPNFTKLYKWYFFNHNSNNRFLTRYICDHCSDLIHSIVVKEAIKRKIPYVFFGYSPDQIARYFYEMPRKQIVEDWMPELMLNDPFFDDSDRQWYLTHEEINREKLPRVILPFHIIPYREQEIIELVESKEYIKKGHTDPLLTNCSVVHAATFYDFNRYGGILYAYQYAELVRQHPELRKKWLLTLKTVAPLILENNFKQKEVNLFLKKIGVSQKEMLMQINQKLEEDPNKKQIKANIKLFRKNRKTRSTIVLSN